MQAGSVGRIFGYGVVSRLYFHLPVLFVFLLLRGYGVLAVEVLLAVYGVALTIASRAGQLLPAGVAARAVIAVGEAIKAIGLAVIVVWPAYWAALAGQVLAGIGFGLTAGRETALLRAVAPPEKATRLQGNLQSYIFVSTLAGGVIGAVLFRSAQSLPFLASIASVLLAAVIVATVPEPAADAPAAAAHGSAAPAPSDGGAGARGIGADRRIWVAFYVVSRALSMALFVGFLPYLFFVGLRLPIALFGVVLGLYSVTAFLSARYVSRFAEAIGGITAALLSALLVLAAVLLFLQGGRVAALVGIAVLGLGAGGVRPLALAGLRLQELSGPVRAALLVRQEQIFGVVNALALVIGGAILDRTSFRLAMAVFAVAYAVFAAGFGVAVRGARQRARGGVVDAAGG